MRLYFSIIMLIISISCFSCSNNTVQKPVIENKTLILEFNDSLKSIQSIIDRRSGRQWVYNINSPLYEIGYGENYDSLKMIKSLDADRSTYTKTKDGIELKFWHEKGVKIEVTCIISCRNDDSLLHWTIGVKNLSDEIICSVEYPKISCKNIIGVESVDDAVLFPVNEGVLLTKMNKAGAHMSGRYPGNVSAQLMYFYDPSGGFYYAAYDGSGYPKEIIVKGGEQSIVFSQKYLLPIQHVKQIEIPYEVVTGCFGGRWEDGASVYREWSDKQIWTEKTISQRSTPSWLKEPNLFINASFGSKYSNVEKADQMIRKYHEFFDVPVVTAVFGWEKHGSWIGPDYFPPNPNKQFYLDLVKKLDERGDHLHFYTSGFRWGIKKPVNEKGLKPRVYTNYDGTAMFMKRDKDFAVTDRKNELVLRKPRWADNYMMCVGSVGARNILDSCYNYIYNLGVAGVDLDQNLGGEVDDCYNDSHGHSKGAGLWQTRSMEKFLSKIGSDNLKRGNKYFQGVEETSERYIPYLDVFHGRSFTATVWPVSGPGAVSIPLYIYLYHQYQIAYAGWIDGGFSPCGYEKYGLGRAFILGMYPGIRVGGNMELKGDNPSDELKMLKGYVELMKEFPEFLLRGRMIGEVVVEGSDYLNTAIGKGDKIPVKWNSVQGICWLSENGDKTAYALANLSDSTQKIRIKLEGENNGLFCSSGYASGKEQKQTGIIPENGCINLIMRPWELAMVKNK